MSNPNWKIETNCIQAGYEPKNGEPRMIPIIQSTTFKYDSSAEMGKLFDLEADGYFYTRLQNPTNDHVAAWPEEVSMAAVPPSMSQIFAATVSLVGFCRRV